MVVIPPIAQLDRFCHSHYANKNSLLCGGRWEAFQSSKCRRRFRDGFSVNAELWREIRNPDAAKLICAKEKSDIAIVVRRLLRLSVMFVQIGAFVSCSPCFPLVCLRLRLSLRTRLRSPHRSLEMRRRCSRALS